MKKASGKASTASVSVTAAAIQSVRKAIRQYVWSCQSVLKFVHDQAWTTLPVNESTCQNADTNKATSEPR